MERLPTESHPIHYYKHISQQLRNKNKILLVELWWWHKSGWNDHLEDWYIIIMTGLSSGLKSDKCPAVSTSVLATDISTLHSTCKGRPCKSYKKNWIRRFLSTMIWSMWIIVKLFEKKLILCSGSCHCSELWMCHAGSQVIITTQW